MNRLTVLLFPSGIMDGFKYYLLYCTVPMHQGEASKAVIDVSKQTILTVFKMYMMHLCAFYYIVKGSNSVLCPSKQQEFSICDS